MQKDSNQPPDVHQMRDASRIVSNGLERGACLQEAATARQCHEQASKAHRDYLKYVRLAGESLLPVRSKARYGQWGKWLEANCPEISMWTAQAYIRVAEYWPSLQPALKRNPELSFRAALFAIATLNPLNGKPKSKPNDSAAAERMAARLIKEMVTVALGDWTPATIGWFVENTAHLDLQHECENILKAAFGMVREKVEAAMSEEQSLPKAA